MPPDVIDHPVYLTKHIVICVSEHQVAGPLQPRITFRISPNLLFMDSAIDFNDQLGGQKNEVDDESIDHMHSSKTKTEPMPTNRSP